MEHHSDTITDLRTFPIKCPSDIIIGHLKIYSIRNKFELLLFLIGGKVDILLISETKIDSTFPTTQFLTSGYSSTYRLDRMIKKEGLCFLLRQSYYTPCKWVLFFRKYRDILRRVKPQEND